VEAVVGDFGRVRDDDRGFSDAELFEGFPVDLAFRGHIFFGVEFFPEIDADPFAAHVDTKVPVRAVAGGACAVATALLAVDFSTIVEAAFVGAAALFENCEGGWVVRGWRRVDVHRGWFFGGCEVGGSGMSGLKGLSRGTALRSEQILLWAERAHNSMSVCPSSSATACRW